MSFQTKIVTIPRRRVDSGVQLVQRRHDNGVVVVRSENPDMQQYDVLVSLNGTTLRNVEGGLDGITKLFKKHENSDKTIVLHRASRDGDFSEKCCFVDQEKELRCSNKARNSSLPAGGLPLCVKHQNVRNCNFTDDNGKGCKNNARKGCGVCDAHYFGNCTFIENETACQNNATSWSGLCSKHDPNSYRCQMTRGDLRCINSNRKGSGGYCNICNTIGVAERQEKTTRRRCHPPTLLLERMNEIKDDLTLTLHMSELQCKTMTLLHDTRTKMTHDRFQPKSFSVNESLLKLVDELMKEILTDEKYQSAWVRCSDGSYKPVTQHVRDIILTALKGALRDHGGDGFDYRGVLSAKLVNDIIDAIIRFVKDNGLCVGNEDKGLLIVKVGSGGTMGSEGVIASDRGGCTITYPDKAFDRDGWTGLRLQLTNDQRGCAERIAASTLLGLGIGGNILLPGNSVPCGTDSSTFDLYLMISKERSLSRHHAACATAPAKSPSAPPGCEIVRIETAASAPTAAAAGGGGGVDDDAVWSTDANTSATAGENTNIQFCGDCAVEPSEVATATPTEKQEVVDVSNVEFDSTQYNDDDDKGSDRFSPTNVDGFPYESTKNQQRGCSGKDLGGFKSEHTARQGVGSCDNNQFPSIDRKRGRSIQSNADGPSPKIYQPAVSRQQLLSNPPENAQNYKLMAEACVLSRQLARDNYAGRLSRRLIDHPDVSFGEAMAAKSEIEFMADSRVSGSPFEEVEYGCSQPDSNVLYNDTILKKRSGN